MSNEIQVSTSYASPSLEWQISPLITEAKWWILSAPIDRGGHTGTRVHGWLMAQWGESHIAPPLSISLLEWISKFNAVRVVCSSRDRIYFICIVNHKRNYMLIRWTGCHLPTRQLLHTCLERKCCSGKLRHKYLEYFIQLSLRILQSGQLVLALQSKVNILHTFHWEFYRVGNWSCLSKMTLAFWPWTTLTYHKNPDNWLSSSQN